MQWISVKDKIPNNLEDILFTDGREVFRGCIVNSNIDEWYAWTNYGDETIHNVTHWMTLPSLPK